MKNVIKLQELEEQIFNCMELLYKAIEVRNLDRYNKHLITLELLNATYALGNDLKPFLGPEKVIKLYEKKWEIANG